MVAMLAARFDISPVKGGWVEPSQARNHGATSVLPPSEDVRVRIRKRDGFESGQWRFSVEGLKAGFVPLVPRDLAS